MLTTKELGVRRSDPCLVTKLGVHRATMILRSFRRLSLPFLTGRSTRLREACDRLTCSEPHGTHVGAHPVLDSSSSRPHIAMTSATLSPTIINATAWLWPSRRVVPPIRRH